MINLVLKIVLPLNLHAEQVGKKSNSNLIEELRKTQALLEQNNSRFVELERRTKKLEAAYENAFDGVILAFNRKRDQQICPDGWVAFKPGKGRFLVGAGTHSYKDADGKPLSEYDSYADDGEESLGGFQNSTTVNHLHSVPIIGTNGASGKYLIHNTIYNQNVENAIRNINQRDGVQFAVSNLGVINTIGDGKTGDEGISGKHRNLPPYVPVYFCTFGTGN